MPDLDFLGGRTPKRKGLQRVCVRIPAYARYLPTHPSLCSLCLCGYLFQDQDDGAQCKSAAISSTHSIQTATPAEFGAQYIKIVVMFGMHQAQGIGVFTDLNLIAGHHI